MKKTKKNWALRLAGITLLFTLVSTCLLGGTLAKYVTTDSGSDNARVAKWGVVVSANGTGLFETQYAKDDTNPAYASITNSVAASVNVVAPGTSGSVSGFSVTGTPEVACVMKVTADRTNSKLENWTLGVGTSGTVYEPVIWKINGTVCGTNGTFAELLDALDDIEVVCAPGTNLATALGTGYTISWDWDFDANGAGTNDVEDTYLGNKAAAPTVNLAYSLTVTQIN